MAFWKKAVLCIIVVELLGNASGLITFLSIEGWYEDLVKPPGNPPNGVFGPVWTTLYALKGIALAMIWDSAAETHLKRPALRWFGLQFVLNLLWTPAFFGLHRIDLAFFIIVPMLFAIGMSILTFRRVNPTAAALIVPYFLWVGFATYLNAGFWILNG
ncbi:MAG: TspO/MBR family protein [Verrucomicrobiota bacterium]